MNYSSNNARALCVRISVVLILYYFPIYWLQTCYAVELLFLLGDLPEDMHSCRKWIETHIHNNIKPKEAFFAVRALEILNADKKGVHTWLAKNSSILGTRVDKNLEDIYYYVAVLHEMNELIPSLLVGEILERLKYVQKKYQKQCAVVESRLY